VAEWQTQWIQNPRFTYEKDLDIYEESVTFLVTRAGKKGRVTGRQQAWES